jgi:CBS domain-containing protein
MSEQERFATSREALRATTDRQGPTPQRYRSALERYLAAVAAAHDQDTAPHGHNTPLWRLDDIQVRDVMTAAVVSVGENTPFKEIVEALAKTRVSAVPVLDDAGRVLGIVSVSDLVTRVATAGHPDARVPGTPGGRRATRRKSQADTAGTLMTAPPVTIHPNSSIVNAARAAAKAHVRRLPVIDEQGVLVGIVTRSDLLRVFLRGDAEIRAHIIEEILTHRFCTDPSSIDVTVQDGVVTLTGQLERRWLIAPLLQDTRAVAGVVSVQDHLTYHWDDTVFPAPREPHY